MTLCAPGLPPVGEADFGIDSPSAIANSTQLAGERIASSSSISAKMRSDEAIADWSVATLPARACSGVKNCCE